MSQNETISKINQFIQEFNSSNPNTIIILVCFLLFVMFVNLFVSMYTIYKIYTSRKAIISFLQDYLRFHTQVLRYIVLFYKF